jgi:hypothetical protein
LLLAHASWLVAKSRSDFALSLARAQGIVAEILFYRAAVKKIGAESPVFCGTAAKNAPPFWY